MLFGLPGKQITLDRFTQAYEKSCGHKLSDYFGHAKLLRLLEDMPDLLEVNLSHILSLYDHFCGGGMSHSVQVQIQYVQYVHCMSCV